MGLRKLASQLCRSSLESVRKAFAEHFENEEDLFESHRFGEHQDERFSAKKAHVEEHRRLLRKIHQQLDLQTSRVPPAFFRELLQDFHEHTSHYDVQYSDWMASRFIE